MPDYTIGVDMGGTNLRVAAITTDGQLLEKITLGVKVAMGRDYVIGEMCDAIHSLTDKYRGIGTFVGAGIGVPGIIDVPAGIMRKSANLPGWTDYPVREVIEKRLAFWVTVALAVLIAGFVAVVYLPTMSWWPAMPQWLNFCPSK